MLKRGKISEESFRFFGKFLHMKNLLWIVFQIQMREKSVKKLLLLCISLLAMASNEMTQKGFPRNQIKITHTQFSANHTTYFWLSTPLIWHIFIKKFSMTLFLYTNDWLIGQFLMSEHSERTFYRVVNKKKIKRHCVRLSQVSSQCHVYIFHLFSFECIDKNQILQCLRKMKVFYSWENVECVPRILFSSSVNLIWKIKIFLFRSQSDKKVSIFFLPY